MVEWTEEALEAAWNAMFVEPFDGTQAPMIGAALDAAVKAQWVSVPSVGYLSGFDAGRIEGRADAFEEAAKIAESKRIASPDQWCGDDSFNAACEEISEAIRNLAKEGK